MAIPSNSTPTPLTKARREGQDPSNQYLLFCPGEEIQKKSEKRKRLRRRKWKRVGTPRAGTRYKGMEGRLVMLDLLLTLIVSY